MSGRRTSRPMDRVSQQQRGETTDETHANGCRAGGDAAHGSPPSTCLGGRSEGDPDAESQGYDDQAAERDGAVEAGQEQLCPGVCLGCDQAACGRGESDPEYE